MSELKLSTAWQKLADGPARVQVSASRDIEYVVEVPGFKHGKFTSYPFVAGGATQEIGVAPHKVLYVRITSHVEAFQIVDLPDNINPETPAAA